MSWRTRFAGIRNVVRRRSADAEMSAELTAHIEALTERNVAAGMSRDDARYAALREFGGVEQIKERCRDERRRGLLWLEQTLQDIRYAGRRMTRAPGFAATVILTIAIAVGACTALYSVVYGVLLKPLAYPHSERLVTLGETRSNTKDRFPVAPAEYLDWANASSFESMTALVGWGYNAVYQGRPVAIGGQRIGPGYCEVFGINPMLGRSFRPNEFEAGTGNVVILSYGIWQQAFGGDPKVINQTVRLDGQAFTIVGVMPDVNLLWHPSILTPLTFSAADRVDYGSHGARCIARLKPGASIAKAQAEMDQIAAAIARAHPDSNTGRGVYVDSLLVDLVSDVRLQLYVLLGAVVALLLVACVNVANLTLVRTNARRREITTRAALGATRGRIFRQLITESVVLCGCGGILGVLVAYVSMGALLHFAAQYVPRTDEVTLNSHVLVASFFVIIVTGVGIGLLPAFEVVPRRGALRCEAGERVTSGRRSRAFRSGLVVAEIALALLLLIGTGLLTRSLLALQLANQGFDPMNVGFDQFSYGPTLLNSVEKQDLFSQHLIARIHACPDVEAAALSNGMPSGGVMGLFISVGAPTVPTSQLPIADAFVVTPEYFLTLRIPLLQGRGFTADDRAGAPRVVIINQTLARRFFPNANPIGQRLMILTMDDKPDVLREIVGVVGDVRQRGPESEVRPQVYEPLAQRPLGALTLMVRAHGDGAAVRAAVGEIFRTLDPGLPPQRLHPYAQVVANGWFRQRFSASVFLLFSAVALVLASLGIYGVTAYSVALRAREIGIRIALGATSGEVQRLILANAGKIVGAGILVGCAAALATTRVLQSLLFATSPYDPAAMFGAVAILATIALVACWLPARRATRVDPVVALRSE